VVNRDDTGVRALAVVVCAALSAKYIQEFVRLAQEAAWDVWVFATPNARSFINEPLLHELTGHPVFTSAPSASEAAECTVAALPCFSAVVVLPATFNTIKKWAAGILDTYALVLLDSWMQVGIPIFVFPRASAELAQELEFRSSLAWLCAHNVSVNYDLERFPPNNNVSWDFVLQVLP
jgi:phosphopantothenoylcysteine decarboxylase